MDLCLAHFKGFHTIGSDDNDLIDISELGRSGRDLRMSYLLRSMEYDPDSKKKWKWNLRQTAVYHSFDAETGQSFWCNIKANDEFQRRIKESASHLNLGKPGMKKEHRVPRLFAAALSTHLIYLFWCDENWRWCINDMEAEINNILEKARLAPIDDRKSLVPKYVINRAITMDTFRSQGAQENAESTLLGSILQSLRATANSLRRSMVVLSHLFSEQAQPGNDLEMGTRGASDDPKPPPVHFLVTLDEFRVSEIQALHLWGERIERSVLAVQLNLTVLREISAYYGGLKDALVSLHGETGKQYGAEIEYFSREITNIARGLETRKTQLQSLAAQLSEGQKLVSHRRVQSDIPLMFFFKVRRPFAISKHPDRTDICRKRRHFRQENGIHGLQDGTGDGIDAYHHHSHTDIPPGYLRRCKHMLVGSSLFQVSELIPME